ncbi:Rpn family recombination-promoting nuclease/putative transposase [Paenibacillaceae bacterium WGS1546]|uniref:Rpn family recombination-promoting nuclease/putative transposase n=1 Tax=Cohnella sp. WGS1546 TaxID=3366810 RepID=UPI00372D2368
MDRYRLKPKNDFVFGRLFGAQESKESLIALLNAILRQDGSAPIVEITIVGNRTLEKTMLNDKTGSLDILAILEGGERVNIEMQVVNPYNMVQRTLFYMAKLFASSIKPGENYRTIRKTIVINLLDFKLLESARFHHTFHFRDDLEPHLLLTDVLEAHFIEFSKFEKAKKDKRNPLHRWLMFMDEKLPAKELKELTEMDPIIGRTEERLEFADEHVRRLADARDKALRDWNSSMEGSYEEGLTRGMAEGEAKGRVEGKAEGKAEGEAKGKEEIARNLLRRGMEPAFVAEVTGLSIEAIEKMKRALS